MGSGTVALAARDLQLGHRSRRDGGFTLACRDLNLQIAEHEFVVIVGPSGCGKTTFLEAVAGLVPVAGGSLELSGRPITGPGPERSLVFQNASLFPWRTVMGNVLYGPQVQHRLTRQVRQRARDLVEVAGLTEVADQLPARAVRRHAAAGEPGAGAGHRPRPAAAGRAVRRAGRAEPRDPAGRTAAHLAVRRARRRARRRCSSRTTSTRPCCWPTACSSSPRHPRASRRW